MATGFKKRAVSADRVAAVESVSANIPIVGDPRMAPSEIGLADTRPVHISPGVGSSQLENITTLACGRVFVKGGARNFRLFHFPRWYLRHLPFILSPCKPKASYMAGR